MKIGFSTLCCMDLGFDDIVSLARESGIGYVELRVDSCSLEDFASVERPEKILSASGIVVTDIASSIHILGKDLPRESDKYIALAEKYGARGVRIFAGESPEYFSELGECDVVAIAAAVRELCRKAYDKGIEIWLETHSSASTGRVCESIIRLCDMPNLKILWDVMHSLEYGETLDETYSYIGDYVAHIHIKDGRPSDDKDKIEYVHTDLGLGAFPLSELVALLKREGFEGCLSLEWEAHWREELRGLYEAPNELLENYVKMLRKVL